MCLLTTTLLIIINIVALGVLTYIDRADVLEPKTIMIQWSIIIFIIVADLVLVGSIRSILC